MKPKSILLIEDEHALGSALALLVRRMGHLPTLVASGGAGLDALKRSSFDAAVIDIGLPDINGLEVLESIRRSIGAMPVLVITAHATLQHAINSQKSGATAYLNKPLDMEQLRGQLAALLEPAVEMPSETARDAGGTAPTTLIGAAPAMRNTFVGIARACAGDFPVLIWGPTGSGKSLAARVIHAHSGQSSGPFHEVACSSLTEWQIHDEWQGGSLVLDELTDLAPQVQAALATELSGQKSSTVRLLATLSMDPAEAVEQGRLRQDLYFALKPAVVQLPPLRERSSDIPALCSFFAGLRGDGHSPEITPPAMAALQSHAWPGNVRELRHVLDVALSMSHGGPLFLSHLPKSLAAADSGMESLSQLGSELELALQRWLDQELAAHQEVTYDELLQALEAQLLSFLMQRYDQKPTRLAAALNLHRGTLRQKLQRLGLQ